MAAAKMLDPCRAHLLCRVHHVGLNFGSCVPWTLSLWRDVDASRSFRWERPRLCPLARSKGMVLGMYVSFQCSCCGMEKSTLQCLCSTSTHRVQSRWFTHLCEWDLDPTSTHPKEGNTLISLNPLSSPHFVGRTAVELSRRIS